MGEGGEESSADRGWDISRSPGAEEGASDGQMRHALAVTRSLRTLDPQTLEDP